MIVAPCQRCTVVSPVEVVPSCSAHVTFCLAVCRVVCGFVRGLVVFYFLRAAGRNRTHRNRKRTASGVPVRRGSSFKVRPVAVRQIIASQQRSLVESTQSSMSRSCCHRRQTASRSWCSHNISYSVAVGSVAVSACPSRCPARACSAGAFRGTTRSSVGRRIAGRAGSLV